MLVIIGPTRFAKSAQGVERRDLSPDEVRQALIEEIGLSAALVDAWVRCGALDASFVPPSGPTPLPVTGLPPSKRRAP